MGGGGLRGLWGGAGGAGGVHVVEKRKGQMVTESEQMVKERVVFKCAQRGREGEEEREGKREEERRKERA